MLENKKEKISLINTYQQSEEDIVQKLKKKFNKEIDNSINEFIVFLKIENFVESSLLKIKECITDFIGYKISNSLSIKINNILLSKYENYLIFIHQDKSIIIKNEEDLINLLNIINIETDTKTIENNSIKTSIKLNTYEQKVRYNYNIEFGNVFGKVTRINIDIALQMVLNNLFKKLIILTYTEFKKTNSLKQIL